MGKASSFLHVCAGVARTRKAISRNFAAKSCWHHDDDGDDHDDNDDNDDVRDEDHHDDDADAKGVAVTNLWQI